MYVNSIQLAPAERAGVETEADPPPPRERKCARKAAAWEGGNPTTRTVVVVVAVAADAVEGGGGVNADMPKVGISADFKVELLDEGNEDVDAFVGTPGVFDRVSRLSCKVSLSLTYCCCCRE